MRRLGPDVMAADFDVAEVVRRAVQCSPDYRLGELLLDQQVVSGFGNIYRCESLFVAGFHMPFPGLGHVEKSAGSYRWVPVSYQLNL